jgi:hypothetical protein
MMWLGIAGIAEVCKEGYPDRAFFFYYPYLLLVFVLH